MDQLSALQSAIVQPLNIATLATFGALGLALAVKRVPAVQWGGPFISVGILGTFVGIMVALLGFDTTDIDASVPALLNGMKTAFLSSVVGMTVAVLTRVGALMAPRADGPIGPTGDDFILVMREQRDALAKLQKSIGGDGDHSLLTQIRLANGEMTALKAETTGMRADLNAFMDQMSKQSSEAIIEALKQVIREFNSQLNEQFGDNFKQLNQGVERLVGWMDTHQKLVTESHAALQAATTNLAAATQALTTSASALTTSASAITTVEAGAKGIHLHMANTAVVLKQANTRLNELSGGATNLAQSTQALNASISQLQAANEALAAGLTAWTGLAGESGAATEKITALVQSVEQHSTQLWNNHEKLVQDLQAQTGQLVQDLQAQTGKMVQDLQTQTGSLVTEVQTQTGSLVTEVQTQTGNLVTELQGQASTLADNLQLQTTQLATGLSNAQKDFFDAQERELHNTVERQGEALQAAHRDLMQQTRSDLQESAERNKAAIQQQVEALDQALEDELSKSLQAIAGKLASLSEKFAADYLPLTQQLARVVRLAEDIDQQARSGRHGR